MERVQPEANLVIVVNQLAAQHARADLLWVLVKTQVHSIKTLVRIAQVGFRWLTRGFAITRLLLGELIDPQHLPRQIGNRLHAFKVFKFGSGRQLGDGERTDLSLQVRCGQAWAFMLSKHSWGGQRRRCQNNYRERSGEVFETKILETKILEMSPVCHVNVYLESA